MDPKSKNPLGILLASLVGIGAASGATVIFSDSFNDNGRTNGADANDIPWYSVCSPSSFTTASDSTAPLSGNTLSVTPNGTFRGAYGIFNSSITVGSGVALGTTVGDQITVEFDFRWTATVASNLIRLGL